MSELLRREPALLYLGVRIILYVAVALGATWLTEDLQREILGVIGIMLSIDTAGTIATRNGVVSPATAEALVEEPHKSAWQSEAGKFIKSLISGLLPAPLRAIAESALTSVLLEFAGAKLDVKTRAEIQRRVHLVLRDRGLIRGKDL